jgi:uncharacterized protein with FMN-binding domain
MRRSTAAAVGTLTGAALIVGVRLSVTPVAPVAAPPVVDLAGGTPTPASTSKAAAAAGSKKKPTSAPPKNGLKDGIYKGKGATNPYGTIQVSIKIEGGEITDADATYPVTGNSATINPAAIPKLNQESLQAKSAKDVSAVSGATFTSASYQESLQSALDSAKA